jgi:UDP-glucose 4-epimerase
MKVVVTGVSGRLGQLLARTLTRVGHEVIGIDRRPWPGAPEGVEMHEIDLRKRPAEAVVRSRRPDALVHMATVAHLQGRQTARNRMSLGATKAAIDYCDRYQVGQAIFVGRHTYYGASPDSPLYHNEDEPPVNSDDFPELADLVAADLFAGSALWRHPQINTAVLRLCYTLGPSHHGTLAGYLSGRKVPTVMGFDPLFQFIHEADAVGAIIAALQAKLRGVFNVAGPSPLPLSKIIEEAGREQVPIPETLFRFVAGRFGFPPLPAGAINHIKFPVVVDTTTFRQACGFIHRYDEYETLAAFREPELVTKSDSTI